jgi:crotonobetainyl-CoA:carnitine CoA-transferase CaiB-like acyl-CoA transferase
VELFRKIKVLSLEQATVLPYLTYRLALEGMEVIRLEHPVYGDPNRMIGENRLGEERMNSYFLCINAEKRAITLDLGSETGQGILKDLIRKLRIDIFATNQLPRNYEKLGIHYERLKRIKEDIIWFGVTGFGPQSNEAAYDPILQARGGLMELTGEPHGDPQVLGIPLPDMGASEHGYGLIMRALYAREATGKGSRIDLSMFESTVSWLTVPITLSRSFGRKVTRRGNTHEFFAPVSVYQTRDSFVYIAVGNDRQWASMTDLEPFKGLKESAYETNAGRIEDVAALNRKINAITKRLPTNGLLEMFNRITVPISKIQPIDEVTADPLVRGKLLRSRDERTGLEITLAPPPFETDFLKAQEGRLSFPPRFGEHNDVVYGKLLGYSAERLGELRAEGVI